MHLRLRDLREEKGYSQTDMANILHIGPSTCSDDEWGKLNLPIPVLKKLAVLFDTSIDYLLKLTDDATPTRTKRGAGSSVRIFS